MNLWTKKKLLFKYLISICLIDVRNQLNENEIKNYIIWGNSDSVGYCKNEISSVPSLSVSIKMMFIPWIKSVYLYEMMTGWEQDSFYKADLVGAALFKSFISRKERVF